MTAATRAPGLWSRFWRSRAPVLLAVLPVFWMRLAALEALPVFFDEALHIQFARTPLLVPKYFDAFVHARWLNIILIALLQPLGLESVWLARAASVLLSLLTAASTYFVGHWAGGRPVARLALGLYAVMPFAYFYDRQAMSDPIMAAFGSLGLVLALRAFGTLRARYAVLAGIVFALSALTKFTGVVYVTLPFVMSLVLPTPNRRRSLWLAIGQAAIFSALFSAVFLLALIENGGTIESIGAHYWCHSPQCSGQFDLWQTLNLAAINMRQYGETILPFYTPAIWLLAVAGSLLGLRQRRRRWMFLSVPAFVYVLPYIPIADLFPPRYIIYTLAPIAALAAIACYWLWNRVRGDLPAGRSALVAAGLTVALAPAFALQAWQAVDPFSAPLPRFEWHQYEAGWPTGTTAALLADDLHSIQSETGRRVNVIVEQFALEVYAYWGQRHGLVESFRDVRQTQIVPWLASGDPVCVVELSPKRPLEARPFGLVLEPVASHYMFHSEFHAEQFDAPSTANLYCAQAVTLKLSDEISGYALGDPGSAASFYQQAAVRLGLANGPILLFPSNQLDVLRAQPGLQAKDLQPILWPVDWTRAQAQVEQAVGARSEVWAVLAFGDRHPTAGAVEGLLYSQFFRIETQSFGPVRVLRLLHAVPGQPAAISQVFGKSIELADAWLALAQDNLLLVRLTWRSQAAAPTSYKVFTHVFDAQGALVAQRDDFPHAGHMPTSQWRPGDVVIDQYGLSLAGLPAGSYTVSVGLYDPVSGQRLATAGGPDSITIGSVAVQD